MKTYLFDFDGTLVDSMPSYAAATVRVLDENHVPYSDDIVKITTPLGYQGAAELYVTMGLDKSVEEIVATMKAYALEDYTNTIPLKTSVKEFLVNCKENGIQIAILTASPHAMLDVCLKRVGVYELFDHVWSSDDFGMKKSEPEIYHAAAKRLGADVSEITFFDDNLQALQTAKRAGLRTVGVFDASSADCAEEIKATADRYILTFGDLL